MATVAALPRAITVDLSSVNFATAFRSFITLSADISDSLIFDQLLNTSANSHLALYMHMLPQSLPGLQLHGGVCHNDESGAEHLPKVLR